MAMQYQGKIDRYDLSASFNGDHTLKLWIHIPKLNKDIELEETGSLYNLEDKYPFIKKPSGYGILGSTSKICLIEKDDSNAFHFVAYLTLSATL
jgi:hypothetical protein